MSKLNEEALQQAAHAMNDVLDLCVPALRQILRSEVELLFGALEAYCSKQPELSEWALRELLSRLQRYQSVSGIPRIIGMVEPLVRPMHVLYKRIPAFLSQETSRRVFDPRHSGRLLVELPRDAEIVGIHIGQGSMLSDVYLIYRLPEGAPDVSTERTLYVRDDNDLVGASWKFLGALSSGPDTLRCIYEVPYGAPHL